MYPSWLRYLGRAGRGLLVAMLLAMSLPAHAAAAGPDYSYWIAHPVTKVYTNTPVPSSAKKASDPTPATMALYAARSEFEGRQIAIRPVSGSLQDVWLEPSDLSATDASGNVSTIPASNVTTYKVHYVRIKTPSYGYYRTGLEPDPLLPMTLANGERLGWMPQGAAPNLTRRGVPAGWSGVFYVLFKVPEDAVPGVYSGTIRLTCSDAAGAPAPEITIPVSLTVYPFSIAKRNMKTAMGFQTGAPKRNTARGDWLSYNPDPGPSATRIAETTGYKGDQWAGWMKYLSEHRVSPYYTPPMWENRASNGTMNARSAVRDDYYGTGPATTYDGERLAFTSVKVPNDSMTSYLNNPYGSSSYLANATRYYRSVSSELGSYRSKAFVYPYDEPHDHDLWKVRRYASLVQRIAPSLKYLLTTDPGVTKGRLVSGVDIYVLRLQFIFRDAGYSRKVRGAGKAMWIYTAKTKWQKYVPGYLLDKPRADVRAEGWFAWRTRANGVLHYGANHYGGNDPYVSQLDTMWASDGKRRYANGDAMLIYPGYYPNLGLVVEGAPPVGSMRMEAFRDGMEDFEYIRMVKIKYGTYTADKYVSRVIGRTPPRVSGKLQFPSYHKDASSYEYTKRAMAGIISH